ncbi:MAG: response regulator [Pseudomonadales bacterium]|nr:response regulator [Pseudomonadales bacterium]
MSNSSQPLSRIDYGNKYVLVVDDFDQHLQFMRKALQGIGFANIELAQNPKDAIALCADHSFDIIFCDYNMGEGKNGQQLLQELRHYKQVRHDCIFIMITAETSREVVLGAIESEPEGYIAKPFNEAVLRRKLDRLMDKQTCLMDINTCIEEGDLEKAIVYCHESAERHPRHHSWCLKTAAELHVKLKQYNDAKAVYKGFLKKRVLDWALLGLAKTYIHLEEYEKAIDELQQVLVLNTNCVPAYDLLAVCHEKLNNLKEVQVHLSHAAKLSPNSVARQNSLGDICAINEDFEFASKAYRSALRSAKHSIEESPDGYFKLASAITDSMDGDLSRYDSTKAVEAHKVLAELDDRFEPKEETETRKDLVNVRLYLNQQNPERALSVMSEIESGDRIEIDLLSASALFDMGQTLLALGDEEKAHRILLGLLNRDDVKETRKLHIRTLVANSKAGELGGRASELNEQGAELYENDKLEDSIKIFSEASRLSPKSVVVNLNLTQALLRYMETEKVTKSFKKQSEQCLECIGELQEDSRHFARYKNLSQRFDALSGGPSMEN